MACAQARTIYVRAAALPSQSKINYELLLLQRLLLDSTLPLPYQQVLLSISILMSRFEALLPHGQPVPHLR
jgi:hypothetical protein